MLHEWKVGDWAESGGNRYLVYKVASLEVYGVLSDHLLTSWFHGDPKIKHLPECTGWDWEPLSPEKPQEAIQPPPGYRLMNPDETIRHGDMFWQDRAWNSTGITCGEIPVGEALRKYARYRITAYARKIEPKYRPFAGAEEFLPHRDKWFVDCDGEILRAVGIGRRGCTIATCTIATRLGSISFLDAFSRFKFEDGTPFGVLES